MGKPFHIGIIAGDFHQELAEAMIASAKAEAARLGVDVPVIIRVPGSYETPLIADALLARDSIDALVVLGYIERGETLHGEVMGHAVHQSLIQLQIQHKKPIGMGIIGPGATSEQAQVRKESYAAAALRAAVRSLDALASVGARLSPSRGLGMNDFGGLSPTCQEVLQDGLPQNPRTEDPPKVRVRQRRKIVLAGKGQRVCPRGCKS